MIREVLFPMHTQSENDYRSLAYAVANAPKEKQWAIARAADAKTKKQRDTVRLFLDATFPRPPLPWTGVPNTFDVTITRVAPGTLDGDNLGGALKAIQDEIAAWIGLDDRDPRVAFHRLQQVCALGYYGIRITIADDDARRDVRKIIGDSPKLLGDPEENPSRGRPGATPARRAKRKAPAPAQELLPGLPAFAVLPWDQDGGPEAVLTELPRLSIADPPLMVKYRYPGRRDTVTLRRGRAEVEDVGACWLYAEAKR